MEEKGKKGKGGEGGGENGRERIQRPLKLEVTLGFLLCDLMNFLFAPAGVS